MSGALLLVDTSSQAQVVAVHRDGELFEQFEIVGRGHSQKILPAVESVLHAASVSRDDLTGIVYGRGPGSFTGVRIAVGVVQGLAFGLGIATIGVSTLAVLAQEEYARCGERNVMVALTAREDEVYFGSYVIVDGIARLQGREGVFRASQVPSQDFDVCHGVGSGWALQADMERAAGVTVTDTQLEVWPRARGLLTLGLDALTRGDTESAAAARPEYLRERVADKPKGPRPT